MPGPRENAGSVDSDLGVEEVWAKIDDVSLSVEAISFVSETLVWFWSLAVRNLLVWFV